MLAVSLTFVTHRRHTYRQPNSQPYLAGTMVKLVLIIIYIYYYYPIIFFNFRRTYYIPCTTQKSLVMLCRGTYQENYTVFPTSVPML